MGAGKSLGCAAGDTQRSPPASEITPGNKFLTAMPKRSYCRGQGVDRKGEKDSFPPSLGFPKEASKETADPSLGLIYSLHQKETASLCLSFITQTGTEMMGSPSWHLTLTFFSLPSESLQQQETISLSHPLNEEPFEYQEKVSKKLYGLLWVSYASPERKMNIFWPDKSSYNGSRDIQI